MLQQGNQVRRVGVERDSAVVRLLRVGPTLELHRAVGISRQELTVGADPPSLLLRVLVIAGFGGAMERVGGIQFGIVGRGTPAIG